MQRPWISAVLCATAFLLALSGANAATWDKAAAADPMPDVHIDSHKIEQGSLTGLLNVYSRSDGTVLAVTFESTDGQLVPFPAATIAKINAKQPAGDGEVAPMADGISIVWIRNMPGGGSVYSVRVGGTPVGLLIEQPNGTITYVAL